MQKFISNESNTDDVILVFRKEDFKKFSGLMECIAFKHRLPNKDERKLFNKMQDWYVL